MIRRGRVDGNCCIVLCGCIPQVWDIEKVGVGQHFNRDSRAIQPAGYANQMASLSACSGHTPASKWMADERHARLRALAFDRPKQRDTTNIRPSCKISMSTS
jgi:hypothetical protein